MRRKKKEKEEKEEVDKVEEVEEDILMLAALEEDLKGSEHSFTDSRLIRLAKNIIKWLQRLI